ncbi:ATP-grasp domain-containing protein [Lactiplantibacillus mudanjiangensis]|uniref:Carbamoyl-phosphate-synthetase [Lactobacillus sp.] n=1 Tax=Lactiplantibacillus mudanjiangensis TaxID=1296538 RepID=A0A660E3N3_9LACO|nr:ATP-grasp domain-containing protein [Lactiplantibacillus mudanjiangensis]VDG19575.1 carbamoyl-phosphate-synthetase [Lactobacillus sp.] [Lactiplantibacillus mudanjiangensis]VDG29304.1 carbamoyl-phosphate-synthetase [Lactobacillus sp.] [Lactiplantibacillus mudanjiangensis]VDG31022.1 carbamoyl-phosphate-synthetase [Lactobacillus sp.] [Lactiplantibacillus mudanjiangensis]
MSNVALQKVLIIGAGHNDIGREGQHDAAITQIGSAIRKLGIAVIFVDNNPFSVAAENNFADKVYLEPLTVSSLSKIIAAEQPDGLIPSLGGIQRINLIQGLIRNNVLKNNHVQLLQWDTDMIDLIVNPALMSNRLKALGQPVIASQVVASQAEADQVVSRVGFPVIVKSVAPRIEASRQLCEDEEDLARALEMGFKVSATKQCIVEQSIVGYKEIEFIGLRDCKGTSLLITGMENFDPVGIHSADSIVFVPTQTITDQEYQQFRQATLEIMQALHIIGPCHVQFALDPTTQNYYVIKVTPYFDRAMALAARATGYPLATISANLIAGVSLAEVKLPNNYRKQTALIEPVLDHIVCRIPVWPFNVLKKVSHQLDTVMESTGAVLGVGRSTEEALLKGLRATDESKYHVIVNQPQTYSEGELIQRLIHPQAGRMLDLLEALNRGYQIDELAELTKIDAFYFYKLSHIIEIEKALREHPFDVHALGRAKYFGFTDEDAAVAWQSSPAKVSQFGLENEIHPTFKEIEPTAGEFTEQTNTYYSTYEYDNESQRLAGDRVVVIGSGANRIGTNHGNDYLVSQLLFYLKKADYQPILINANPNSVAMTPQLAVKRYVEPKQVSDVLNVLAIEKPSMIFTTYHDQQLGRQLMNLGYRVIQIDNSLPQAQLKTNDQPAVEVISDGKDVTIFGISEIIAGNNLRTDVHGSISVFPLQDKAENQAIAALMPEIKRRVLSDGKPGVYTVRLTIIDATLRLASVEPMSIAKMALISKASGSSVTRLLLHVKLGESLEQVMYDYPDIAKIRKIFVQANTFPYNQLQIFGDEITGEPGHATGTVIAHGATLRDALIALKAGNEQTDF